MLHRMVREFTENELAPVDMEIDAQGDYPQGLFQKVIDNGLLTMTLTGAG